MIADEGARPSSDALPVKDAAEPFGLYIHIPFCSFLCHYCDFAKTARWDKALADRYFARLAEDLDGWLNSLWPSPGPRFSSVNFGGGTPSIFVEEYAPLLAKLRPYLRPGAEISLEANPGDIDRTRLRAWVGLGFTRISLGVQTFVPAGLAFLKRTHSAAEATQSIELALDEFANVNVDLIYSWPGQTGPQWLLDLMLVVGSGVPHLSLYNLMYAQGTPIGRAHQRGRITEPSDDEQESFYVQACHLLEKNGYAHEEVSNWAKPHYTCRHNWLYWQDGSYLGLGLGAHGYLPRATSRLGLRYSYEDHLMRYLALAPLPSQPLGLSSAAAAAYGLRFEERDNVAWLMEYIGCGLRCQSGIDLRRILMVSGHTFSPSVMVEDAFASGKLLREGQKILLNPQEWFRETAWSLLLFDCFVAGH